MSQQQQSDEQHQQHQNLPFDDRLILDHPLNSPREVKEAWRFIRDPRNADRYPKFHVEQFKQMVHEAAREYGIELDRER
jgi:hypothetical protein